MSVTVTIYPDKAFGPPRAVHHRDPRLKNLGASIELGPRVDMLLNRDADATVPYLRAWAANLTALADEIEAAAKHPRSLAERVYLPGAES